VREQHERLLKVQVNHGARARLPLPVDQIGLVVKQHPAPSTQHPAAAAS
jgi:hypothetical protein